MNPFSSSLTTNTLQWNVKNVQRTLKQKFNQPFISHCVFARVTDNYFVPMNIALMELKLFEMNVRISKVCKIKPTSNCKKTPGCSLR